MLARMAALAAVIMCGILSSAQSQTQQSGAVIIPEGPGLFYRVDEGLIQINERQVIDLSDLKISFMFFNDGSDRSPNFMFILNGQGSVKERFSVGDRVDLKYYRKTSDLVQDRERCFLDVIQLQAVRGAKAVGFFRFECL